ncbi:transposable element Tcb2 transposase [Trichonephila clavipes]|nr:transposable element Tcb2 transposase [Trichonephila clavipes]
MLYHWKGLNLEIREISKSQNRFLEGTIVCVTQHPLQPFNQSINQLGTLSGSQIKKHKEQKSLDNKSRSDRPRARTAHKEPYISKKNRVQGLEFARKYAHKPVEFWHNITFADESKFNLFGYDGKIIVYRKHNAELEERNMVSTVKYGGGGIMVWGCMESPRVGNVVVFNGIIDHLYNIQIFKENLRASAEKLEIEEDYQFY